MIVQAKESHDVKKTNARIRGVFLRAESALLMVDIASSNKEWYVLIM